MRWNFVAAMAALIFFCAHSVSAQTTNPPPDLAQHVSDNATLLTKPTTLFPRGVWRDDYASGNGAPPLFYVPSGSACSLSSGAGDNGSQVESADGKCWTAKFPERGVDWREFGVTATASDNHATWQNALNAAFTAGAPLLLNGAGTYSMTAPVYFYPTPVIWGSHATVIQRNFTGYVMRLVDAVGHTYPQNSMMTMTLEHPTIDMNSSIWTTEGGAGIVVSAVNNWKIEDPWVYNIPTRTTPAPSVSGSPPGTFEVIDAQGIGWAENGGIVMLGDLNLNTENGHMDGGFVGNFATPINNSYTCAAQPGAAGLVLSMTMPQAAGIGAGHNPANGNSFRNTEFDCNSIGVRNDYGGANRFENIDTTLSGLAGIALGTYGRADYTVGGTPSGTSTVGLTILGPFGTETVSYTGAGSDSTAAAGIVSAINGNTTLATNGITAGQYGASATFWVSWADEHSLSSAIDKQFNINVCGHNSSPQCSGALTLAIFFNTAWNQIDISSSEQSTNGAINSGANNIQWVLNNPQQMTNSIPVVAYHGGSGGAGNPIVTSNNIFFAANLGTPISGSFTTNCASDPQPYIIGSSGSVATLGPTEGAGTKCSFVDANGNWGIGTPFTVNAPASIWGNYTINGFTSIQSIATNGKLVLTLARINNNTGSLPTVNSGGNWITSDPYSGTPYTPTIACGSGSVGVYSRQNGSYQIIGGTVSFMADVQAAAGTCSGTVSISLPIAGSGGRQAVNAVDTTTQNAIIAFVGSGGSSAGIGTYSGSNPTVTDNFLLTGTYTTIP